MHPRPTPPAPQRLPTPSMTRPALASRPPLLSSSSRMPGQPLQAAPGPGTPPSRARVPGPGPGTPIPRSLGPRTPIPRLQGPRTPVPRSQGPGVPTPRSLRPGTPVVARPAARPQPPLPQRFSTPRPSPPAPRYGMPMR